MGFDVACIWRLLLQLQKRAKNRVYKSETKRKTRVPTPEVLAARVLQQIKDGAMIDRTRER